MQNKIGSNFKNILLLTVIGTAPFGVQAQTATASAAPQMPSSSADAVFVQQAAKGGMAEVELSKIAATGAASPDVRKFADHMVRDHTKNNQDLATIAAHENIALPKDLDTEHAQMRDKLSSMHGPDLDRTYMMAMRQDHQKMEDLLKSSEGSVTSNEMKTFIKTTLPVVEDHLRMAQQISVR